jgi:rod shape-determining protein MreD
MKLLTTVLLALLLLTVESVLVKYLGFAVARIDVTVVLIAFLALRASLVEGAIAAFAVGYLLDLMSGQPTGLYTFLGVLLFLLGRLSDTWFSVRSAGAFVLFSMAADVAHGVLSRFFSWMVSKGAPAFSSQMGSLLGQVMLTGAAALVLYPLLNRLESDADRSRTSMLRS